MTALRRFISTAGWLCLLASFGLPLGLRAQAPPADSGATIKTESRLVIVDTVVTDKKGAYVENLAQKNFRVFEDGKEMGLKSFSSESEGAAAGKSQPRYIVLFFDNSTMDAAMQQQARMAAAKFIDANAGPSRLMAVVNFGGAIQIAQNFTANAERLKQVVSGIKFSSTSPNVEEAGAGLGAAGDIGLSRAAAEFGARNVIIGLQSLAKNLAQVPGRKSLILLTAGFVLSDENLSELTALINTCNKSNVAVYPIDARGLVAGSARLRDDGPQVAMASAGADQPGRTSLFRFASFVQPASFVPVMAFAGAPPAGGGGGRSGGGGSPSAGAPSAGTRTSGAPSGGTPTRGSTPGVPSGSMGSGMSRGGGGTPFNPYNTPAYRNPLNQPRQIIPKFPESAAVNQQFMYALAAGTGGFVIANTNDLLGGFEKIGREQNEYYLLGYVPPESEEGTCHTIQVKIVDRGGTTVRSRSGYCNARPRDLLAGSSVEKGLEAIAAGKAEGTLHALMLAPYFYTSTNVARVNVAMEMPIEKLKFEKEKGKFNASIHILGLVRKTDGAIAARFSDTVKLHVENKKDIDVIKKEPLHYENQFDVASGQYTLQVAFSSSGENFGKVEAPLVVDPYKDDQFSISGVALSRSYLRVTDAESNLDEALLADRKVLISRGVRIIPSGSSQMKATDKPIIYVEVYDPALRAHDYPMVALQLKVVDRKTGQALEDTGFMSLATLIRPGNPVIPIGIGLPLNKLTAGGQYRAELQARDSAGRRTSLRTTEFDVE